MSARTKLSALLARNLHDRHAGRNVVAALQALHDIPAIGSLAPFRFFVYECRHLLSQVRSFPETGSRYLLSSDVRPAPGAPQLPDLAVIRLIGRGGFGEVWLARTITGAVRAVKIVRRSSFSDPRPFEREFEGVKRSEGISREHPGLADVLHVGRSAAAELFYYVMELADDAAAGAPGTPLEPNVDYQPRTLRHDLKTRGHLSVADCLRVAAPLAEAVAFLHAQGLIHRDIKSSNVIFVEGQPKLADIGLVTSRDTARSLVGTEGYLPPEGPGTEQADVYALGKLLYEISTGLDRQAYPELPPDFREFPDRDAFLALNELISHACDANPRCRPSASKLALALKLLAAGKRLRRCRRRKSSLLAAVFVTCGAGLAIAFVMLRPVHHYDVNASLVASFPFDGSGNDASGNGHHAEVNGVTLAPDRNGRPNSAYWFDGVDDHLVASIEQLPVGNSPRTIVAWIKPEGTGIVRGVVQQGSGDCKGHMFGIVSATGALSFWGGCQDYSSNLAVPLGMWSFVVITYDGTTIRLRSNRLSEVYSIGALNTMPSRLFIGAETLNDGASFRAFFRGFIDDVRIYNRALSPDEVRELYQQEAPMSEPTRRE